MKNFKLVADFDGIKLVGGGQSVLDEPNLKHFRVTKYETDGLCQYCHNDISHGHSIRCYALRYDTLLYNSSWDALIPVIRKIREIVNVELDVNEYYDMTGLAQRLNPYDYDIDSVYNAVVEFIKWYNQRVV